MRLSLLSPKKSAGFTTNCTFFLRICKKSTIFAAPIGMYINYTTLYELFNTLFKCLLIDIYQIINIHFGVRWTCGRKIIYFYIFFDVF